MSNHTETDFRMDQYRQWQSRCRSDIRTCLDQCARAERGLGQAGRSLAALSSDLTSLATSFKDMGGLQDLIQQLGQEVERFEAQLAVSEKVGQDLAHRSRQTLDLSRAKQSAADLRASESQAQLQSMAGRLTASMRATEHLGDSVSRYLDRASRIIAEITRQQEKGAATGRRVEQSWDALQQAMLRFSDARQRWQQVQAQVAADHLRMQTDLSQVQLMLDALSQSEAATYAVFQTMLEQDFKVVAYARTNDGVEAFLEDENQRMIALQIRRQADEGDRILLDLDLSGFDIEGENRACDAARDRLLQRLMDKGVLTGTRVSHPHWRGAAGGRLREPVSSREASARRTRTAAGKLNKTIG